MLPLTRDRALSALIAVSIACAFALQHIGGAILIFATSAAALVWGALALRFASMRFSRLPESALSVAALLGSALLSALVAHISTPELAGAAFETGTLGAFLLFALSFVAGSTGGERVFRAVLSGIEFLGVLLALYCGGAAMHLIPIAAGGESLSFALVAAAAVAAIRTGEKQSAVHATAMAVSIGGMFALLVRDAALAGMFALVLAIAVLFFDGARRRTLFAPILLLAVVTAGFIFLRSPLLSAPSTAVRPTLAVTEYVMGQEYLASTRFALIGTGPGRFSWVWNTYRPATFNATDGWNVTPHDAYSTIVTFASEIGILGAALFLLCPLLIAGRYVVRSDRPANGNTALVLVVFVFASAVLFPVESAFIAVGFFALGYLASVAGTREWVLTGSAKNAALAVVLCIAFALALMAGLQLAAAASAAYGDHRANVNDALGAADAYDRAAGLWGATGYRTDAAIWLTKRAYADATAVPPNIESAKRNFTRAAAYADLAAANSPKDFDAWFFRGTLYTETVELGLADATAQAEDSLRQAALLSPTRPDVLYMAARLGIAVENTAVAQELLREALALKPDYTDAHTLLTSLGTTH